MSAARRRLFDEATAFEEWTRVSKDGDTWVVRAHSVTFTFTWTTEGDVTIRRRGKTATATMDERQIERFKDRIKQGYIEAALALFDEIQAELAAVPSRDISDERRDSN